MIWWRTGWWVWWTGWWAWWTVWSTWAWWTRSSRWTVWWIWTSAFWVWWIWWIWSVWRAWRYTAWWRTTALSCSIFRIVRCDIICRITEHILYHRSDFVHIRYPNVAVRWIWTIFTRQWIRMNIHAWEISQIFWILNNFTYCKVCLNFRAYILEYWRNFQNQRCINLLVYNSFQEFLLHFNSVTVTVYITFKYTGWRIDITVSVTHKPYSLLTVQLIISRRKIYMQTLYRVIIYHTYTVAVKVRNCKFNRTKFVYNVSNSVKVEINIVIYRNTRYSRYRLTSCCRTADFSAFIHKCVCGVNFLITVSYIHFCITRNWEHVHLFCFGIKTCQHYCVCSQAVNVNTHK